MMMAISLRNRSKVSNNCSTTAGAKPSNGSSSRRTRTSPDKRAGYSHHLLLAAGEIVSRAIEPFMDSREILVDALAGPVNAVAGLTLQAAELKVLFDAHAGEQATALRHIADAELGILGGRIADQFGFGKLD